jgi:hypothetical protein
MTKEIFFALLTIRILNLKFSADQGWNPKMVTFKNAKGNSIYITEKEDSVNISVYKVTASCLNKEVKEFSVEEIESIATTIKEKLKLLHDIKE